MIKKLLYPGIAAALGLLITSGLYLTKEPTYQARESKTSDQGEPNMMEWAKIDLRTGEYNPFAYLEARSIVANRVSRGTLGLEWLMRGPDNVGGRTRAVIELYKQPDTLIAGGVTGGLFYSYNSGGTWQPHAQFDNMDTNSSIISCIHQDTATGTIYVGTGSSFDAYANSARVAWPGYGIFVSTDGGVTFSHLSSTTPEDRYSTQGESWIATNRIRTNSAGIIYAATERGLQISTDDGESWTNPIYVDEAQTIPFNQKCADVVVGHDDKVLVSFLGGAVYLSENGTDFVKINDRGLPATGGRTVVSIPNKHPNYMYVMFMDNESCFSSIYKSTDGGENFYKMLEKFAEFSPMQGGSFCQGMYDAAMMATQEDPNTVFIGGVELWRFDGSLSRVATEGGSPPFQDVLPNYVHADKHYFYQSPNDPGRVYVTSDGGIAKTENRGSTWQGLNKGFVTTQFYGIGHFNGGGTVVGGTQDNGTLAVLGINSNDPNIGYQVFGNDGIDCDVSQEMPIVFASSQNGLVVRVDVSSASEGNLSSQPPFAFMSGMGSGGPFHTVVKLWENTNDLTSKDSIEFSVEPTEFAVASGNGILRNFNESFTPIQPAAIVIESSIEVRSSGMVLTVDPENPGELIGDGEGTVTFKDDRSIDISVTFDNAPSENANVLVSYEERFEANDVLIIESQNLRSLQGTFTFEHRLENDLNPGDVIKIQDPVQSLLFSTGDGSPSAGGAIRLYRNVLNAQALPPRPFGIGGISGAVSCVEFANDGNTAFIGTQGGALYRVSGLQDVYSQDDADNLQPELLLNMGGNGTHTGGVIGIALDYNDNNRLVVTGGGYGATNRVRYSDNALSATPTFENVHGDLPPFPVYDAEFNVNEPNMVLLGTEFGIWATSDITAGLGTTWSEENHGNTWVPTHDIRQQALPFDKASNSGVIYVGTHGRGLWESTSLVGTPDVPAMPGKDNFIADMMVYPNPIQSEGMIAFESGMTGQVNVMIYDINGRQVNAWQERVKQGNNRLSFNAQSLRSGSYFVVVESQGQKETAKFIVMH